MKKIIITILTISIIVGVTGMALNRIFGEGVVSYLDTIDVNGIKLYQMNIWAYIENIKTNVTDVSILSLDLPTRQWNQDIINNLMVMTDYLILVINILIYPIRVGAYTMRLMFVIVGYNFSNPNPNILWLVRLVRDTISAQIPYV